MLTRLGVAILLPYFLLLAFFHATGRPVPMSIWLLTANYDSSLKGFVQPLWFISAYAQATLLVVAAAAALPPFRRLIASAPWRAGIVAAAVSVIGMLALVYAGWSYPSRSFDQILPLIALGWCLAFADSIPRKIAAGALAIFVIWGVSAGDHSMYTPLWTLDTPYWVFQSVWMLVTMLMLLVAPRLLLPRWIALAAAATASAAFTIYLTHTAVLWVVGEIVHNPTPGLGAAAFAIAFGVALQAGLARLGALIAPLLTHRS